MKGRSGCVSFGMQKQKMHVCACARVRYMLKEPSKSAKGLSACFCYSLGNRVILSSLSRSSLDAAMSRVWAQVKLRLTRPLLGHPHSSKLELDCCSQSCLSLLSLFPYKPVLQRSWQTSQRETEPTESSFGVREGHTHHPLDCHPFDCLLLHAWYQGNKVIVQPDLSSISFLPYLPPHPFLLGRKNMFFD